MKRRLAILVVTLALSEGVFGGWKSNVAKILTKSVADGVKVHCKSNDCSRVQKGKVEKHGGSSSSKNLSNVIFWSGFSVWACWCVYSLIKKKPRK